MYKKTEKSHQNHALLVKILIAKILANIQKIKMAANSSEDSSYNELKKRIDKIIEYIALNNKENEEAEYLISNLLEENQKLKLDLSDATSQLEEKQDKIKVLVESNSFQQGKIVTQSFDGHLERILVQVEKLSTQCNNESTSKEIINKISDLEDFYDECELLRNEYLKNASKCLSIENKIRFGINELENKLKNLLN